MNMTHSIKAPGTGSVIPLEPCEPIPRPSKKSLDDKRFTALVTYTRLALPHNGIHQDVSSIPLQYTKTLMVGRQWWTEYYWRIMQAGWDDHGIGGMGSSIVESERFVEVNELERVPQLVCLYLSSYHTNY